MVYMIRIKCVLNKSHRYWAKALCLGVFQQHTQFLKVSYPCMGSGHILVYAFDVLMQIYVATGYSERDAVKSILKNNLFGLDIDDRAYQLSYFAVMMKARKYCRTIFSAGIRPNLYSIQESNFVTPELIDFVVEGDAGIKYDLQAITETLYDAKEYGSILNVPQVNYERIYTRFKKIQSLHTIDLQQLSYQECAIDLLLPLIYQAQIMSSKYDVVVTNPPYMGNGGMSAILSEFVKQNYPDSKSDLFAVFIERGFRYSKITGYSCMVTMQSWMFLSSFEKMRERIVITKTIINLMHMENMVMGIAFGTAVAVFANQSIKNFKGTFNQIKLCDISEENHPISFPVRANRFSQVSSQIFAKIPGMPIAYWVSNKMQMVFAAPKRIRDYGEPRHGMSTGDNERCLKFWHEIDYNKISFKSSNYESFVETSCKYIPYNKGGAFRKWYGNNDYVIAYDSPSLEYMMSLSGYRSSSLDYFFRPSINWSDVTSGTFGVRFSDQGFAFDGRGASLFSQTKYTNYLMAVLCSKPAAEVLKILNPTITFNIDNISSIPVILDEQKIQVVDMLVSECIELSTNEWDSYEFSWDFLVHPLVLSARELTRNNRKISLSFAYSKWEKTSADRYNKIKANEEELNRIIINIYGLQDELNPNVEAKYITVRNSNLVRDIRSLLSYAVGVTFGRYSLDIAGLAYASRNWDNGKYLKNIPDKDNILPISDDVYFEDDIVSKVVDFVKVIYGEEMLEENLQFIADALGNRGDSSRDVIRNYFLNDFYKDHLKIYQKRPIYWLFDSGKKNGFKALIYMHRYQPNLLATIRTDYVHEQQERYRTQLQHLEVSMQHATPADQAKINKQIGKLKEQTLELLGYEEKIHHLADQMIDIDLDDGVKVNYAKFEDVLAPIK